CVERTWHELRRYGLALTLVLGLNAAGAAPDISFRNEVEHAIDRGLEWLQKNQGTNGVWSTADQPAVTALALVACKGDPRGRFKRSKRFIIAGISRVKTLRLPSLT